MVEPENVVFLLDVDNTLLDNDRVAQDLREYLTEKSCAPHCTVSCVHQVSVVDRWRAPQKPAPAATAGSRASELVQIE